MNITVHAKPIVNVDENLVKEIPNFEKVATDPNGLIEEDAEAKLEDPQNIGLILDSSGSMGQILEKNKSKMFFLKKIMKGFVQQQWKQKNKIGVRVYGARKKNACDDIQMVVPYSNKALPKLESTLEGLSSVGMTPLHKSIQMTVDEIKNKEGKKSIVIVTDGQDTCGGNPCESAEKAKKEKLGISFYVVALGFKGATDELKKVTCMGGDVTVANDEESLADGISQIASKISNRQNLKVISPNEDAAVFLYRIEDGKKTLVRIFYARQEQTVPPGTYEAVVGLTPPYKFNNFNILPGRKVTLKVQGDGELLVKYFNGLAKAQLLDKDNKVILKFKSDTPVTVPSGKWRLRLFKDPFYEKIITEYFVYPQGKHNVDLYGVGAVKVTSDEPKGVYLYDRENNFIDHGLTNQLFLLKTGIYAIHVDETCSFEKVEIHDKREVLVLPCPAH